MSEVLVVQPDFAQAETLRDIFRRVAAELVLVESTREAMDAIVLRMPDLILLSTLLSPREEDALMANLRTLKGASHLQTLTIPLFRSATEEAPVRKSGFSFRKKPKAPVSVGCDPAVFAEEVVAHLRRAHEIRNRPVAPKPVLAPIEESAPPIAAGPVASLHLVPSIEPVSIEDDEIDRLARQLGLDVTLVEIEDAASLPPLLVAEPDWTRPSEVARGVGAPQAERGDRGAGAPGSEEEVFDFGAALDRARVEADGRRSAELARAEGDAEAIREAAIADARAAAEREAREALAVDLARVQAEAEAMRETAIAEARAAAEREARETLDAELARVRSETEVTVADALNKVKLEAEEAERARVEAERLRVEAQEAFAAELARVRAEVEQSLAAQLDAARAEAERMRVAEGTATRERAAAEAQLKSEIDRLRFVAAQTRKTDESETRKAGEQIKQLESELANVHAKTEERQVAQLEELRAQMAEMREAAAQQARAAAAEAVASDVARATAQARAAAPRRMNVIRMQPRASQPEPVAVQVVESAETPPPAAAEEHAPPQAGGDYYSLWQPGPRAPQPPGEAEEESEEPRINFRRHAKWALPVAACLLLVTNAGTAISTVARFVGPVEKRALTVEPVEIEPFIEVVEQRVGSLQVESAPAGAEAVVDGRSYGKTPVTIPDLEVGSHTLVLKSSVGTITRKVAVKANETTRLAEAIFSGWLAIFSPIPVTVVLDGEPVNLTDDGRFMTTPGKHVVELISERFNYRATETLEVRPGETTAHTLSVPMGTVRVTAPEGAEIRVDGQPATGVPAEGLSVSVGSHEISATHPELGERRVAVDVRHGALTEVTLQFEP